MSSRSTQERRRDILNAIESIQQKTNRVSFEDSCQNDTLIKAILYDLIIIGEAASNIPPDTQALAPEIPWRLMSDMRNVIAHEYFQVKLQITWSTIQNNLPPLVEPLQQFKSKL